MIDKNPIEIRKLNRELAGPLHAFFEDLIESGDQRYFHPHPFTRDQVNHIVEFDGDDLYFALLKGSDIFGYGMLRGWDEGFVIPSLGIIIRKNMRGKGFGKLLMHFLHVIAKERGADQVRLKVYPDNLNAINLYESMGYKFGSLENGQLVGFIQV